MGKPPAFQFYPADWLNDIKLQSCSLAAQGLLINMMCLMHQSDEYGYLLINGSIPESSRVSHLLRLHHKTYDKTLIELISSGVLKVDERGVIYCERMVKDEHIRQLRREAGKLGGNPLLKQKVNQSIKQKSTPSSSSSSSYSNKEKHIALSDKNLSKPEPILTIPLIGKNGGYPITQSLIDEWKDLYPAIDVLQTLRNIRGWNIANQKHRKTATGILKHINSWLAKEQNKARKDKPDQKGWNFT